MLRSFQLPILAMLVCSACATTPARLPVSPEPVIGVISDECRALGEVTYLKREGPRPPYGWSRLRIDVEQGAITKVELVDSSPKGLFDDAARAVYTHARFASLGSAQGCIVSHKWD